MASSNTQTLGRTVRFLSDKTGLRLIRASQGEVFLPSGQVRADPTVPEVDYQFQRGALEVREGQDMLADKIDPETGEPVMQDAVEYLRNHDWYGTTIHEVPRDATAPDPGPLYGQIAALAAKGDRDGLIELGQAEYEEYGRADVLNAVTQAIEAIDGPAPPDLPEAA